MASLSATSLLGSSALGSSWAFPLLFKMTLNHRVTRSSGGAAFSPCFLAFCDEMAFPSAVVGPVARRTKASALHDRYDFLARRSELVAIRSGDLQFTPDGALKGMIRKSKTDQYGKGRFVFGSERSSKLVRKWLRLRPREIQPVFCAINHGQCLDRPICDRNVNEIIKKSVVKIKRCERPSDLEVSGHSLRVGAAQDLLIKGYDLAAIMRAGGWSNAETVSRYLPFSQHNIWK